MLVTGGSGFIGSAFINSYGRNFHVENYDITNKGDVRNFPDLNNQAKNHDCIVNMAAISGVMDCYTNPVEAAATNTGGAVNVLEAGREHNIRVILASSGAASHPTNPYAASKMAMESFAVAFAQSYDVSTTCLRFTNVYGPGSIHKSSAMAAFCKQALTTGKIIVNGDGKQTRDFVFIDDVVEAIKVAIDTPAQMLPFIIQVCGNNQPSIREIAYIVSELAGGCEIVHTEPRIGDVPSNIPGNDYAKLAGTTDWRDGLEKTFNYFKEAL